MFVLRLLDESYREDYLVLLLRSSASEILAAKGFLFYFTGNKQEFITEAGMEAFLSTMWCISLDAAAVFSFMNQLPVGNSKRLQEN